MGDRHRPDRAETDPTGLEADWEGATQENTGQYSATGALAVVRGEDPAPLVAPEDEPVVNGYKGGDRRTEIPIEQIRRAEGSKPPPHDY